MLPANSRRVLYDGHFRLNPAYDVDEYAQFSSEEAYQDWSTALVASAPKETRSEMNDNGKVAYCKPNVMVLGSVMEVIRGTLIKGHRGIIEAIHWRILPAYDLDE